LPFTWQDGDRVDPPLPIVGAHRNTFQLFVRFLDEKRAKGKVSTKNLIFKAKKVPLMIRIIVFLEIIISCFVRLDGLWLSQWASQPSRTPSHGISLAVCRTALTVIHRSNYQTTRLLNFVAVRFVQPPTSQRAIPSQANSNQRIIPSVPRREPIATNSTK
jgi:hypothetical protein